LISILTYIITLDIDVSFFSDQYTDVERNGVFGILFILLYVPYFKKINLDYDLNLIHSAFNEIFFELEQTNRR
jgi:hypothetical protein